MYGPLDMVALTGEKVDVHLLRDATTGEWELIGSEVTDKTGRLVCPLPKDCTLPPGLHPIKMVVRGDHTYADLYMAVLPLKVGSYFLVAVRARTRLGILTVVNRLTRRTNLFGLSNIPKTN